MANLEGNCKWNFATLPENMLGQSANNALISHFNKSPFSALIREAIQNSLDAPASDDMPVRVEFSFGRIQVTEYPNFFELREHIKGIKETYGYNDKAVAMAQRMEEAFQMHLNNARMPFIQVSDYNTKGMPFRPKGQGKSPFSSFLRIAGDSLKNGAGSGGSFGFGKAAYFNISPIRTVLVSTKTDDGETFFEGGVMLTDHKYQGVEKSHFGFYDNNDGNCPISTVSEIPEKFRRSVPGTDFFIMGVKATDQDRDEAYQEMIEATLRNFWLAIYHNKLEVKIGDALITSDNISDYMERYFPDIRDDKNRSTNYNPRPYFEAVLNAGLNSNHILIKKSIPLLGEVSLYIKKVKDAKDKIAYMRSPRMLVYSQQFQTSYGCYCLFFCDDEDGNILLGKLENAAHKEWEPGNFSENKSLGKEALTNIRQFISQSLEEVFASDADSPLGITGLEEYLYIEDDMLPSEDEDISDNPFYGSITGEFTDEGTSMTSKLNPIQPKLRQLPTNKPGHVVAKKKTKAKEPYKDGKEETGLGGNPPHEGEGHQNRKPSPGDTPKSESEDGKEGEYKEFIPVRYRVVATPNKAGKMEHTIIITSPRDIEDAMIEILVVGEEGSEALEIADTLDGDFNGNQVFGLSFIKGRNTVTVQFHDNIKHPITLKSYEYK